MQGDPPHGQPSEGVIEMTPDGGKAQVWYKLFCGTFRPSPPWQMMGLINRTLANTAMIEAEVIDPPTRQFTAPLPEWKARQGAKPDVHTVATVIAHAFKADDGSLRIAVVNLDLNRDHQVMLDLPVGSPTAIRRHSIQGDPRDTNLEAMNTAVKLETLDPTNATNTGLKLNPPAGKAFIVELTY